MTTRSDFVKYNQLQRKVDMEINSASDERLSKLKELRRRCFPTKEQVIAEVQAFFNKEVA